jgi:solute carrier family 20 (sodium-dependent phosphate transporter)
MLGCGIATVGFHGIDWGFRSGVSQMFVLWAVSPLVSAFCGAIIFLLVKQGIMKRAKPARWALGSLPFFYALTGAMLTSTLRCSSLILERI